MLKGLILKLVGLVYWQYLLFTLSNSELNMDLGLIAKSFLYQNPLKLLENPSMGPLLEKRMFFNSI